MKSEEFLQASIEGLSAVGSRYVVLTLRAMRTPLTYTAGQFTQIEFEDKLGYFRKFYSIASAPRPDGIFDLCLLLDDPRLRQWTQQQTLNQTLRFTAPSGRFYVPPPGQAVVMVAGGSGVTPLRAMLEERVQAAEAASSVLLYGCQNDLEIPFYADLLALQALSPGKVQIYFYADTVRAARALQGRPLQFLPQFIQAQQVYLLCGPPAFMQGAYKILCAAGVSPELIHQDRL